MSSNPKIVLSAIELAHENTQLCEAHQKAVNTIAEQRGRRITELEQLVEQNTLAFHRTLDLLHNVMRERDAARKVVEAVRQFERTYFESDHRAMRAALAELDNPDLTPPTEARERLSFTEAAKAISEYLQTEPTHELKEANNEQSH